MKIPIISNYLNWLQQDAPFGNVEQLPELSAEYETSTQGIYCIGDLTGMPLIKTSLNSGVEIIDTLMKDQKFTSELKNIDDKIYDIAIAGAGPAGVAAAIRAKDLGLKVVIFEASKVFNTIHDYPSGKPIHVNPQNIAFKSKLSFENGNKESLILEFEKTFDDSNLKINLDENVKEISGSKGNFIISTSKNDYQARKVIVAIGKSGNARRLGVKGEELDKVFSKLTDPALFKDKDILIVGGGDSAIETAVALANAGNRVTLSYRKPEFSRPKVENLDAFNKLVVENKITAEFNSNVKKITTNNVTIKSEDKEKEIKNDLVFILVGREIPVKFFERSKVKMEGEKNISGKIELVALLSFFVMLYFGKVGVAVSALNFSDSFLQNIIGYLQAPFTSNLHWGLEKAVWYGSLNFIIAWLGSLTFILTGSFSFVKLIRDRASRLSTKWGIIKNSYFVIVAIFYTTIHFSSLLTKNAAWVVEPTYWYSLLYCTTMFLFGVKRMITTPTSYILKQTSTLIFIQIFFLFLLPFYLYDSFIVNWFSENSYLIREVFPKGKWSSFGLILFWPLNIGSFGSSTFWTWFPFVQTFIFLPAIIYYYGKGAYCGWICSCGGMAETLGDEYRTNAPHGEKAKKLENIGQTILLFALIITSLNFFIPKGSSNLIASSWAIYKIGVDVIFAGALGLGLYFFYSGRIWCRYGCPLAALMHIYTRFSKYRIFSKKEDCISCEICTKNCHMGIDVMNYASKGIPMNDVECVACSTCIVKCPMEVLKFGQK